MSYQIKGVSRVDVYATTDADETVLLRYDIAAAPQGEVVIEHCLEGTGRYYTPRQGKVTITFPLIGKTSEGLIPVTIVEDSLSESDHSIEWLLDNTNI